MGFLWDMPLEKSRKWNLPGKWQFELGYKISDEDDIGVTHGVLARVRWKTDLRRRDRGN
jgi:hypothetical protein